MRNWLTALLYTGMILTANLASAGGIADLRDGDMKKLVVHSEPKRRCRRSRRSPLTMRSATLPW